MTRTWVATGEGAPLQVEALEQAGKVALRLEGTELLWEVDASRPGELRLGRGDRLTVCHYARVGQDLHLWWEGRTWILRVGHDPGASSRGSDAAAVGGVVTSPMPGNVRKVLVEPGQRVEAHVPVVVLESMKMELSLVSPRAGVVASVACRVGEMVEVGVALVTLEAEGPA